MKPAATPPPAVLPPLHPQIHCDAHGEPTAVTLPYAEFAALEATARAHLAAQEKRRAQRETQRLARKERQKAMLRRDLTEGFAYIRAVQRGEIQPRNLEDLLKEVAAEADGRD